MVLTQQGMRSYAMQVSMSGEEADATFCALSRLNGEVEDMQAMDGVGGHLVKFGDHPSVYIKQGRIQVQKDQNQRRVDQGVEMLTALALAKDGRVVSAETEEIKKADGSKIRTVFLMVGFEAAQDLAAFVRGFTADVGEVVSVSQTVYWAPLQGEEFEFFVDVIV